MNSESPSSHSRQEFCLALKTARERKGITLAEISEATKIPASLFAGLERNDLRRWPTGLFRRSFFRDYLRAIGSPVAETCAEFVRLFPDGGGAEHTKAAGSSSEAGRADELRLELDSTWHGPRSSVLSRLLAAAIDAGAVVLLAAALAWVAGVDPSLTTAVVALAYFSLATPLCGESPAKWAMSRRRSILDALMSAAAAIAAAWRHGTDAISHVFGSAASDTDEPVEAPAMRRWISDARRVGPAPQLRMRIKLPD